MADAKTPVTPDEEWETVAETRTKIIFDTDGDQFTGQWEGFQNITDPNTGEVYEYANFREAGTGLPVTTSASYQLKAGLVDVPLQSMVRITRTGTTDMGKGKNPMNNFKVQVKR
jgi:hypothetical protein